MSYNISLLCAIKWHQLQASSVDRDVNGDDIICDNGMIEVNLGYEIVYILKFPCCDDYKSTLTLYLRSNLSFIS
jgi:hypothetical protein